MLVFINPDIVWAKPKPCTILGIMHYKYDTRFKVAWQSGGVSGWLNSKNFKVLSHA